MGDKLFVSSFGVVVDLLVYWPKLLEEVVYRLADGVEELQFLLINRTAAIGHENETIIFFVDWRHYTLWQFICFRLDLVKYVSSGEGPEGGCQNASESYCLHLSRSLQGSN